MRQHNTFRLAAMLACDGQCDVDEYGELKRKEHLGNWLFAPGPHSENRTFRDLRLL
jgi:hypothetical protein